MEPLPRHLFLKFAEFVAGSWWYRIFATDLRFMSLVGNCKLNYFAAQMTTHEGV